jgi:hypothetical protein
VLTSRGQQGGEAHLALNQRPRAKIFAVDLEKIEQEVDQPSGIAAVRRSLDHAEGGDAVGAVTT